MIKVINADILPKSNYSNAICASGSFVFVATQPSVDWDTGIFIDGDIYVQARKAMENVVRFLKQSGTDLTQVVKIGIFLKDLSDFDAMNSVYNEFFPNKESAPVRFTLQTGFPDPRIKVEFEAIAIIKK